MTSTPDPGSFSLADLFKIECEAQCRVLMEGLLALEHQGHDPSLLESLMRAAHSLKGAARIVDLEAAVRLSHAMEDGFVAAQRGECRIDAAATDRLLAGVDLLGRLAAADDPQSLDAAVDAWISGEIPDFAEVESLAGTEPADSAPVPAESISATPAAGDSQEKPTSVPVETAALRVTAESLDLLLGSAGESLVASRQLRPFANDLWKILQHQRKSVSSLDLQIASSGGDPPPALRQARESLAAAERLTLAAFSAFERFESQSSQLSQRLYEQALSCRMLPFGTIAPALRRTARDTARRLGREVHFELLGEGTEVDRDLLEKIESPLVHLLRNAIDHGIAPAFERTAAGKPAGGRVIIEASHRAGFLMIRVSDDGCGVNLEELRDHIVERGLTDSATAARLGDAELLEFLFLPGFSMRSEVSEISGRGVGLDIVQSAIRAARGSVKIQSTHGQGTSFHLQLPISLSVLKALAFEIAGEPYAMPLAAVECVASVELREIESVEGTQYAEIQGQRVGLVDAAAVLGRASTPPASGVLDVLVLPSPDGPVGVMVSRFLGEDEMVVQPLDRHLGKVRDIAAATLAKDGTPMLLMDVDDFLLSVRRMVAGGSLQGVAARSSSTGIRKRHILVADDSLTVRELERKLLTTQGYHVEVAVDGLDAWNAVRSGRFDAVVSDVDMPRMDGIELTRMIKNDPRLRDTPVIIVSYKDREEDRRRGLDAGADYYLTKGSFQDEGLARAVADVLGEEPKNA